MSEVRPSPELLAVARRWFDAVPNRRAREIGNLMSESPHLTFVGTDEDELWTGRAVRDGVADFFGAVPDFARQDEIFGAAYECGTVGWTIFTHEVSFLNDPSEVFFVRNTLVFTLEHGTWRIIHRHGSVPYPNADFTGADQSAIADLVAAAQEGFALDQREGFATVMFTDIVNSARIASVMGDRLWSAEIARHFGTLRRIIEQGGGQFVKSLGDGTMSSFAAPPAALQAARAIQTAVEQSDGPSITLRIGIHSGPVVQTEADFFGSVVNKAARIAASAGPRDIRVSDATRTMVGDTTEFTFDAPASVALKGFEGEHLVYRLEWST